MALSTLCTASHNHTLDICRIVCKCAKPHEAIKLQFLTSIETQDSPVTPRENEGTERDIQGVGWDMSIPLKLFLVLSGNGSLIPQTSA